MTPNVSHASRQIGLEYFDLLMQKSASGQELTVEELSALEQLTLRSIAVSETALQTQQQISELELKAAQHDIETKNRSNQMQLLQRQIALDNQLKAQERAHAQEMHLNYMELQQREMQLKEDEERMKQNNARNVAALRERQLRDNYALKEARQELEYELEKREGKSNIARKIAYLKPSKR